MLNVSYRLYYFLVIVLRYAAATNIVVLKFKPIYLALLYNVNI